MNKQTNLRGVEPETHTKVAEEDAARFLSLQERVEDFRLRVQKEEAELLLERAALDRDFRRKYKAGLAAVREVSGALVVARA